MSVATVGFAMFNDLRYSLRVLARAPAFTTTAVLILALGIGANTAVFSLVNTLVLEPRAGRIDRALGVFTRDRTAPDRFRDFSYPQYVDLRDRAGVFDSLMAHTFTTIGIRDGDVTRQSFASIVSANYFDTLGIRMAAGRAFTPTKSVRARGCRWQSPRTPSGGEPTIDRTTR